MKYFRRKRDFKRCINFEKVLFEVLSTFMAARFLFIFSFSYLVPFVLIDIFFL